MIKKNISHISHIQSSKPFLTDLVVKITKKSLHFCIEIISLTHVIPYVLRFSHIIWYFYIPHRPLKYFITKNFTKENFHGSKIEFISPLPLNCNFPKFEQICGLLT